MYYPDSLRPQNDRIRNHYIQFRQPLLPTFLIREVIFTVIVAILSVRILIIVGQSSQRVVINFITPHSLAMTQANIDVQGAVCAF